MDRRKLRRTIWKRRLKSMVRRRIMTQMEAAQILQSYKNKFGSTSGCNRPI